MKVLFLNYEYPPLGGGAGNATAYLLREYAKMANLTVHLVTSAVGDEYSRERVGKNVVVHRLPIGKDDRNLHYQSRANLLAYSWSAYFFSRKLIRQEGNFSLIHAFFTVPCGFLAMVLGFEFKLPYIVSLRGADVPGYSERFKLLYSVFRPLARIVWRRSADVISNSRGLRDLALMTDARQEIEIIPNGVDTGQFHPDHERVSDGMVRILVVSRLTPRKGVRFLVRAMASLPESARLVIAGAGGEREYLESLAAECGVTERVDFRGLVPHDGTPAVYRECDIFCLPSLNEGMSNTVLEAIASGLPIVATVTGGTEELVTDGENGFFVKKESPEDLAEKIGKLASDAGLRARMGAASRIKAESMDWTAQAMRYVEEYEGSTKLGQK
ncbi:MAG: glycosyltransferase family 4 protein [Candidatus Moranbacteria bacterium]|nr:glycosyltransferase family 4 protein [Candidatus Moranbacteria bacterium]